MLAIRNKLINLLIASLVIVLTLASIGATERSAPSKNCVGTYLMAHGSGPFATQGLWTFSYDGTFQSSDSAEDVFDFGHGQGVWKYANGLTKMTYLDFGFGADSDPQPSRLARVDADITFSNNCQNIAGSFVLRFFVPAADPLDINNAYLTDPSVTFSGRRLETLPFP